MNTSNSRTRLRLAGLFLGPAFILTATGWADAGPEDTDASYSFARVVEGSSTVIPAGGERDALELQMPLFVGDRLWVPADSRLELVLSDRSLLRVEGDAEIDFRAVAYSADTEDRATELDLRQGEIQLIVPEDALGDALPVIATPDATIYVHRPGAFRVTVSREGWTELVVRDGRAEIVGDHNASLVDPGDLAVVEGGPRPYYDIRPAGSYDSLERWGEHLTREAAYASVPQVDRSLHYVAAPLAEHGLWVTIGGRSAWRPRVAVAWQPYNNGYWRSSPTGLIWVSHDPWGHVTHHYGLWDYVPGYGWVWYPGRTYRTAWVHWYWSPSYVGWCPSGYYASYHRGHGNEHGRGGLSRGIYGYAGGSWSRFEHWSFTASIDFGKRDQHRHVRTARDMGRLVSARELGRGIITTDAGARGRKNPREIVNLLESEVRDYRRTTGRDLPDVSDYVARKPLPENLREAIVKPKPIARPKPALKPKPIDRSRPSTVPPSTVSREFPGSSTRKHPEQVSPTRPPRDPMPRVDGRTRREAPAVTPRPSPSKPSPPPSRVDREQPQDRSRERETDLRDLRDRMSRPPREAPPRRETAPREPPKVTTKPRAIDPGPTVRATPRERETPRAASPRSERPSPPARIRQEDVRRYKETPRVSRPEPEASKPRETVSSSKPRVRTKPSVSSEPAESKKPSVSSKPQERSKLSVKSSDGGKKSSTVKKSPKSSTAKKSRAKGKN